MAAWASVAVCSRNHSPRELLGYLLVSILPHVDLVVWRLVEPWSWSRPHPHVRTRTAVARSILHPLLVPV